MRTTPARCAAIAVAAASLLASGAAQASAVYTTIDLRSAATGALPTPFIAFQSVKADSDGDGWYETVLRINLRDPGLANPYRFAQFRISYDGAPTGMSVNIGDSVTNDGGTGDAGTQSNDAELQIGGPLGNTAAYPTLQVFGNDHSPPGGNVLATRSGFAALARDVYLTVGDEFVAWDNGAGDAGSVSSPYSFALHGQADSEGPVNYDIYAAFNRVIRGRPDRLGAGVGQVTVCLSTDRSCFAVPEPGALPLVLLALGAAWARSRGRPGRPAA